MYVWAPSGAGTQPLADFAPVLSQHLEKVLGVRNLPSGMGMPVGPGVFVTITPQRVQIFDANVATLTGGRAQDPQPSPDCKTGCPAVFFDALQRAWMDLAIEARGLQLEVPEQVLLAGHRDVPASTVVELAYAAAESRPIKPPSIQIVVHGERSGLRMQRVYLLPPQGLAMSERAATLGLTVRVAPGQYTVGAASRSFGRTLVAGSLQELRAILRDIKKHYPGKEAIILEPGQGVALGELVRVIETVRDDWSSIVLSAGQRVVAP